MKNPNAYHVPVMLEESIDGLEVRDGGIYVDVTFGGGGHTRRILEELGTGKVFAFDRDPDAEANVPDDERVVFIRQNFRFMKNYLKMNGVDKVDGIIADLGVSSHQFDEADRGFSIRQDAELDMRMDQEDERSAADFLNQASEEELTKIFREYGELRNASKVTRHIVQARSTKPISTVEELKTILEPCAPKHKEFKFFAQAFQAIRIEVNQELESLKVFLKQSADVLKENGRLVVISYHSLEDKLVKNFIRSGKFKGEVEKDFYGNPLRPLIAVNRKVITPTENEVLNNNRARSAKLRVATPAPSFIAGAQKT